MSTPSSEERLAAAKSYVATLSGLARKIAAHADDALLSHEGDRIDIEQPERTAHAATNLARLAEKARERVAALHAVATGGQDASVSFRIANGQVTPFLRAFGADQDVQRRLPHALVLAADMLRAGLRDDNATGTSPSRVRLRAWTFIWTGPGGGLSNYTHHGVDLSDAFNAFLFSVGCGLLYDGGASRHPFAFVDARDMDGHSHRDELRRVLRNAPPPNAIALAGIIRLEPPASQ